jgi:hypothetical protein
VEVPYFYRGKVVGTSRHYDERLALALLKLCTAPRKSTMAIGDGAIHEPRLDALIERILAEPETDGETLFAADSANPSPSPDAGEMADLRGFDEDAAG